MCGLGVLRATVSQYESESVTQREAEWSVGPRVVRELEHAGVFSLLRWRQFFTNFAVENFTDGHKGFAKHIALHVGLFAEAG